MKLIAPLVALLTLALVTALLVQERQAQNFDNKVAELSRAVLKSQQQAKQLSLKLASAEEAEKTLKAESEELRNRLHEVAAANAEPKADAAPSPTPSEPKNAFSGMLKKMMSDPQMKKVMAQQQMTALRAYYADFIKQAGLSPQEADALFEILGKRQAALMEAGANIGEGTPPPPTDYKEELTALLGEQRAGKFKEFEKSLPDRIALSQLDQQLGTSGVQLNDSQKSSLLQIYSEERSNSPAPNFQPGSGQGVNMTDEEIDQYSQRQADLNQRIATRAGSILTAQQLQQLIASQKQMLEMQKMGMKMAKQMLGTGK